MMQKRTKIFLILLMAVVCTLPLCNDFLVFGHDLKFHLARIEGIYVSLKAGQFPVYINPVQANGFGYASPVMNPQLFLYFPAFLRLCGMDLESAYKILLLCINIATMYIAYFSWKRILKSESTALIGATVYMFFPYRLVDLYTRAAVGEMLALAFLPLVIYGMYECILGEGYREGWIWLAVSYTCVIQSHIISVEICLGFCLLLALIGIVPLWKEKYRIIAILKAMGLAFLMNLGFIVPWFSYRTEDFAIFSQRRYLGDSAVYLSQMFAQFNVRALGEDVGRRTTAGEMPLSVGVVILGGLILFLYICCEQKKKHIKDMDERYKIAFIAFVCGGIGLWMISDKFPWHQIQYQYAYPFRDMVNKLLFPLQFAWRFLGIAAAFLAIPASVGIYEVVVQTEENTGRLIIVLLLVMMMAFPFMDELLQGETLTVPENQQEIGQWTDDLYLYADKPLRLTEERGEWVVCLDEEQVEITDYSKKGVRLQFTVETEYDADVALHMEVPLYYYPGYHAYLNGERISVKQRENGMTEVIMPWQSGTIEVKYEPDVLWSVSKGISFATVLGTVLVVWHKKRKYSGLSTGNMLK